MSRTLAKFVAEWGFCPHLTGGDFCNDCATNPSQRSYSQGDLTTLTHETQVAIFNFCTCEDNDGNENPYTDCPTQ